MPYHNFCDDLDDIINDEYGAMSMYAGMARDSENPTLKVLLASIASDEYNHARTFTVWKELGCQQPPNMQP